MVSIVVINYNTFNTTCTCISSVIEHTKAVQYEIILVDNASTERNPDDFLKTFPQIILIKSQENIGFSKGNNLAIASCSAEVILLLNSDTLLKNDSISICAHELISQTNFGAVTCKLEFPNGMIQHNCQSFPSPLKLVIEKLRIHKLLTKSVVGNYLQGFYWNYEKKGRPDWIWGTFFMFKREILAKMPQQKLDDSYFMYVEDMQWCLDIRKAGFDIAYLPQTTIIHLHGGSASKPNTQLQKNYDDFLNNNYSSFSSRFLKFFS
ncbi:MAG: glycosyltransferase family 2 protein [bacterium]|nr:glycosyltransferase family 2 protein [bacterium]